MKDTKANYMIIDQLLNQGYDIKNKVYVDSDDYINVIIGNNLLVGAESDLHSIVLHTYSDTYLEIEPFLACDEEKIIFTVPVSLIKNQTSLGTYSNIRYYGDFEVVVELNKDGLFKYFKEKNSNERELLLKKSIDECQISDVLNIILSTMNRDKYFYRKYQERLPEIVTKALSPMIGAYLKESNDTKKKHI